MEKKIHIAFTENKLETYIKTPLVRGDENAYKLIMNLEKYPDAKNVFIYAERADGETVYDSFEVFGEKAEYILKQSIYMCVGNMTLRIVLKDSGKTSLTASLLKFNVIDGAYSLNMAEDMGNLEDLMLVAEKKADRAETLSGYGIKDAYTKTEVDNKFGGVYRYCGSAIIYNYQLYATPRAAGDVYNVTNGGEFTQGANMSIPIIELNQVYGERCIYVERTQYDNVLASATEGKYTYMCIGEKGSDYTNAKVIITNLKIADMFDSGILLTFDFKEGSPIQSIEEFNSLNPKTLEIVYVDYNTVVKPGDNVAWTGEIWDVLAGTVDLSKFATKEDVGNIETALDNIIAIQNELIGGDGV